MTASHFNLTLGEVCHFKFNLPKDKWKGVILKINKAENLNFTVVKHQWGLPDDKGYRQGYKYQPIHEGGYYKLGGGDIKEIILTVVVTGSNPQFEFVYQEGWVTLFSRPVYYIL